MASMTAPFNELMEGVLDLLQSKGYMESSLMRPRRANGSPYRRSGMT